MKEMIKPITINLDVEEDFNEFTYSRIGHMEYFLDKNFDIELYGERVDPDNCSLKVYQDLLVFAFIKENVKPGSKLLDIGGGYSRILNYFKTDYECWNIDKLEGLGNGPTEMEMEGIKLVLDYMGNFNKELPNDYFDFVFSISALEHVPEDDPSLFENIFNDIDRVSKINSYGFHCFDVVIKGDYVWSNQLLFTFFKKTESLNDFIELDALKKKTDIYAMSEKYYEENWQSSTKKSFEDFGKPLSYNILWKKKTQKIVEEPHFNPTLVLNHSKNIFNVFIVLREPLDMALLFFVSAKQTEKTDKNDLRGFLEENINLLSKQFQCDENNYLEILNEYSFVSLLEEIQTTFDSVSGLSLENNIALFGDKIVNNDLQVKEIKKDKEFIERFMKRNSLDYLIYNYFKEKYLGK